MPKSSIDEQFAELVEQILAADATGCASQAVEQHYLAALAATATVNNEQLREAYMCFLLAQSRNEEAIEFYSRAPLLNYELKIDYIKTLIRRTSYDESIALLSAMTETPEVFFLKGYAENMRLTRDEFAVFPLYVNPHTAWHQLQLQHDIMDPEKIYAGRCQEDCGSHILFIFGTFDKKKGGPRYFENAISYDQYKRWGGEECVPKEGWFVEVAKKGKETSIRSYLRDKLTDEEYQWITPMMDVNRYLKYWCDNEKTH